MTPRDAIHTYNLVRFLYKLGVRTPMSPTLLLEEFNSGRAKLIPNDRGIVNCVRIMFV